MDELVAVKGSKVAGPNSTGHTWVMTKSHLFSRHFTVLKATRALQRSSSLAFTTWACEDTAHNEFPAAGFQGDIQAFDVATESAKTHRDGIGTPLHALIDMGNKTDDDAKVANKLIPLLQDVAATLDQTLPNFDELCRRQQGRRPRRSWQHIIRTCSFGMVVFALGWDLVHVFMRRN